MLDAAKALERAGAFAVVLEMVTSEVARQSQCLVDSHDRIGAGPTAAQVLVWQDMAGLRTGRLPKFVTTYGNLRGTLLEATKAFASDVVSVRPRRRALLSLSGSVLAPLVFCLLLGVPLRGPRAGPVQGALGLLYRRVRPHRR